MPYAEAVTVTLAAACLLALTKERWVLAGALAGLATAGRPNALALCAACAVAAGMAIWEKRDWRALWAPALSPLGAVGYFAYLWHHTGQYDAWFKAEQAWGEGLNFGVSTAAYVRTAIIDPGFDPLATVQSVCLVLMLGLLFIAYRRWHPPVLFSAYVLPLVFLMLSAQTAGVRPRFLLMSFPLFMGLAFVAKGRWLYLLVCILALCTIGYTAMVSPTGSLIP